MQTGPHLHHAHDAGAPRSAQRAALAALLGLVCASILISSTPGIALPAVFALPVLASALLAHTVATLRRRAEVRRPFRRAGGRRSAGAIWVGGLAVEIGAASVLLVAAVSYADALNDPSNSSLVIRSVEWLRDNGARGLVSEAERLYYSLTAPSPGGPGLTTLPRAGVQGGAPATAARAASPDTGHARRMPAHAARARSAYRPPPVRPVIRPRLPGEGVWAPTQRRFAGERAPPLLVTAYRPDPRYPRLVAGLAWINHKRTRLALYPGLQEPPFAGPGIAAEVPPAQRGRLLATFNGGFKHRDSGGGFIAHGRTFEPLVPGQATILATAHGHVDILSWHAGARLRAGLRLARQNLPLIVDHRKPNPNLDDGPQWGATLGNQILVWRSGVGIDRHGNLIYAAAPDQTVAGLARILIHAGAVRAMELDINSYWVTLDTYGRTGGREPRRLLSAMDRPAQRYLTPDDRDFFAVYLR